MVILTIYFFNYGNQVNASDIKVSFSATRSLEEALDEYSRMQIKKKYERKYPKKEKKQKEAEDKAEGSDKSDSDKEDDNMSEKAADDSLEYFLGATYYLSEIKQNIFIYHFTKKSKYFSFIGL